MEIETFPIIALSEKDAKRFEIFFGSRILIHMITHFHNINVYEKIIMPHKGPSTNYVVSGWEMGGGG